MNRGDIVIVDLRPTNPTAKVRPALVIQNDRDNGRMANTILAQITSNLRRAGEDTQLLVDATHRDWPMSGLRHPSVVNCSNIYTVEQRNVTHVIGSLSSATMRELDECLKAALEIP
jgi:mRNA interferase MazF